MQLKQIPVRQNQVLHQPLKSNTAP